jgi:hemoglobin
VRLVEVMYDHVAASEVLRPLFPGDLGETRDKQRRYFIEIFGGAPLYTQVHGQAFLRYRHRHVTIGEPERNAWMVCFEAGLDAVCTDPDLRAHLVARIGRIADAMVNHRPGQHDATFFRTRGEPVKQP